MIIGMDYINKYNLHVDVQNQLVSIDYNNTIALLPFDKDYDHIKVPVTSVNTVHIPVVSKLKVEFNYSTIAQLFNYWHFIINVFQNTLPKGFRVS